MDIERRAHQIRQAKQAADNELRSSAELAAKQFKRNLLNEFESAFKPVLHLLAASGITYKAHMQDDRYVHMGSYIRFKIHTPIGPRYLNMDFNHRQSYRYEFVRYAHDSYGRISFGKWGMDEFVLWIDEKLIQQGIVKGIANNNG